MQISNILDAISSPFSIPSLLLPITDRTPKGRASGTAGAIKKLLAPDKEGSIALQHFTRHGCGAPAAAEAVAWEVELSRED